MLLRHRLLLDLYRPLASPPAPPLAAVSFRRLSLSAHRTPSTDSPSPSRSPFKGSSVPDVAAPGLLRSDLFVPPGVERKDVTAEMLLPASNIVVGPYAGDAEVKKVEFVKSSARAGDCPKDDRPEFAILGRSNVGKSSLINTLARKREFALTSKKPGSFFRTKFILFAALKPVAQIVDEHNDVYTTGKTRLINHFLVNNSWYIVDLPGYGFANASQSSRTDWSRFTKGYFLNRETLVGVLLLIDASIPPQQVDFDCANWLGRNNIGLTFVFTKCDKIKGKQPHDKIKNFQDLFSEYYRKSPPPWIMTSSVTGLGRDELLCHMSQLRNYWDNDESV